MSKVVSDGIQVKGQWRIIVQRPDGSESDSGWIDNTIMKTARLKILERLANDSPTNLFATHIAIGDGSNTITETDSILQNEVVRVAKTSSNAALNESGNPSLSVVTTFPQDSIPSLPRTLTRLGLFMDATSTPNSGVLLSHVSADIDVNTSLDVVFVEFRLVLLNQA